MQQPAGGAFSNNEFDGGIKHPYAVSTSALTTLFRSKTGPAALAALLVMRNTHNQQGVPCQIMFGR
jgi:hypothetical protein